jgi:hypothetical protein
MVLELPDPPSGGGGYPVLQTMLSGMELLGKLLSGGKDDEQAGNPFWDTYLIRVDARYANKRLRKILRQSIRNGIAHVGLVRFGIRISKDGTGHLTKTAFGNLNIDVVELLQHFKDAYELMKSELHQPRSPLVPQFERGYNVLLKDLTKAQRDIAVYVKTLPAYPYPTLQPKGDTTPIRDKLIHSETSSSPPTKPMSNCSRKMIRGHTADREKG